MSNLVKNQELIPAGFASNNSRATGQNYNGTSGALVLAERVGAAVMVADRARRIVAEDPNFYETYTSDIGRRDWQEPYVRECLRNGESMADMVKRFRKAEEADFLANAPKYSKPSNKVIEATLMNGGTEADCEAAAQMKHRIKVARHNMSKPAIEADVIRFAGWVSLMNDRGPIAAPLSNRAMIARAKCYAKRVISGLQVNSSLLEAEEKIAKAVVEQAAKQNPKNNAKELSKGPRSVSGLSVYNVPCNVPVIAPYPVYGNKASMHKAMTNVATRDAKVSSKGRKTK